MVTTHCDGHRRSGGRTVTDLRVVADRTGGGRHEVRYLFGVDGATYSPGDGSGRTEQFVAIDEVEWAALSVGGPAAVIRDHGYDEEHRCAAPGRSRLVQVVDAGVVRTFLLCRTVLTVHSPLAAPAASAGGPPPPSSVPAAGLGSGVALGTIVVAVGMVVVLRARPGAPAPGSEAGRARRAPGSGRCARRRPGPARPAAGLGRRRGRGRGVDHPVLHDRAPSRRRRRSPTSPRPPPPPRPLRRAGRARRCWAYRLISRRALSALSESLMWPGGTSSDRS